MITNTYHEGQSTPQALDVGPGIGFFLLVPPYLYNMPYNIRHSQHDTFPSYIQLLLQRQTLIEEGCLSNSQIQQYTYITKTQQYGTIQYHTVTIRHFFLERLPKSSTYQARHSLMDVALRHTDTTTRKYH